MFAVCFKRSIEFCLFVIAQAISHPTDVLLLQDIARGESRHLRCIGKQCVKPKCRELQHLNEDIHDGTGEVIKAGSGTASGLVNE
jgi:hypothetical protein